MRRLVRTGLALLGTFALAGCFSWTHQGSGPTRTFANPSEGTLTAENVGLVEEMWTVPSGQVLVTDSRVLVQGNTMVTAYDTAGAEIWSAPGRWATIESDTVFVSEYEGSRSCTPEGCGSPTSRSAIVARSVTTGEEIPALTERFPDDSLRGPYLEPSLGHRYRAWHIATRSWDRWGEVLYAPELRLTDVETGAVTTFLPEFTAEFMTFRPLVDETTGRLYFRYASCCNDVNHFQLKGVDLATGNVLWSREDLLHADLGVEGDRLYVVGSRGLNALDSATGEVVWSGTEPVTHGAFAISGGRVYVGTEGSLVAYEDCGAATCAPSWSATISPGFRIIVAGELVYTASVEGEDTRLNVYAADGCGQVSCEPVASWLVSGTPGSGIVVGNGRLFVNTSTGVHAFGLPA